MSAVQTSPGRRFRWLRRAAPWSLLLVLAWVVAAAIPSAFAYSGTTPADAIPVGSDGRFAGQDAASSSTWYRFSYAGGGTTATVTLSVEPTDSNRLDMFLFTVSSDPTNPRQEGGTATRNGNVLTQT